MPGKIPLMGGAYTLHECTCGSVVAVDPEGRKFEWPDGRLHLHVVGGAT